MRQWWRSLGLPEKAVLLAAIIGALVALLVGVLGAAPNYVALVRDGKQAIAPSPDLKVIAFSAARRDQIDEDYYDGETKIRRGRKDVTQLDVTVQNLGKRPSLITRAEFEIRALAFSDLKECGERGGGGPLWAKTHYNVALGDYRSNVPFKRERALRFEVKPGATERLAFHFGPPTHGESSNPQVLFSAKLTLYHDNRQKPLIVGTASFIEPSRDADLDDIFIKPYNSWDARCTIAVARSVEEFVNLPGERSPALVSLAAKARRYLGPDLEMARRICSRRPNVGTHAGFTIQEVCATYTRWILYVEVHTTGSSLLRPRPAILSLEIRPFGGQRYKLVSSAVEGPDGVTCLGPAAEDDPWSQECTKSSAEWKSNRVSVAVWTEAFRSHKNATVVANLYKGSGDFVDAMPDDSDGLAIVRGK